MLPRRTISTIKRYYDEAAAGEGAARERLRFVSLSFFLPFPFFAQLFSCPFCTLNGP